jgi:hypothetical protein
VVSGEFYVICLRFSKKLSAVFRHSLKIAVRGCSFYYFISGKGQMLAYRLPGYSDLKLKFLGVHLGCESALGAGCARFSRLVFLCI